MKLKDISKLTASASRLAETVASAVDAAARAQRPGLLARAATVTVAFGAGIALGAGLAASFAPALALAMGASSSPVAKRRRRSIPHARSVKKAGNGSARMPARQAGA